MRADPAVEGVTARAYTIPTVAPGADWSTRWSAATIVIATLEAGGRHGIGCIYASGKAAGVVRELLAVDVLQADATRCGGVDGFMQAAALCDAFHLDLSAHCALALHCHLGVAAARLRHLEWFHDHVRIEAMLFDGAPVPQDGSVAPGPGRPGLGLAFRSSDAERFAS